MGKMMRQSLKMAFWSVVCVVVLCAILAACIFLGQADNSITPFDYPGRYFICQVLYDDPNDEYLYTTDNTLIYDFFEDYTFGVLATEKGAHTHLGDVKRIRLNAVGLDRHFSSDASAWPTDLDAAFLRKQNHFAWKMVVDEADASTIYYILQQKNKDVVLLVGTRQKNGNDNSALFHCGFLLKSLDGDYQNGVEQEMYGDIDGDGKDEVCYLCYGPLSGPLSFRLVAKSGGQTKNNAWFTGRAVILKDAEGKLKLKMHYNDGMEVVVDVKMIDGEWQLYKDNKPFEYYAYWRASKQ